MYELIIFVIVSLARGIPGNRGQPIPVINDQNRGIGKPPLLGR
jgi:hypothetical protein